MLYVNKRVLDVCAALEKGDYETHWGMSKDELYDAFIAKAKSEFAAKYGHEPKIYPVVISDGARKLA